MIHGPKNNRFTILWLQRRTMIWCPRNRIPGNFWFQKDKNHNLEDLRVIKIHWHLPRCHNLCVLVYSFFHRALRLRGKTIFHTTGYATKAPIMDWWNDPFNPKLTKTGSNSDSNLVNKSSSFSSLKKGRQKSLQSQNFSRSPPHPSMPSHFHIGQIHQ